MTAARRRSACCFSLSFIGREACARSTVPLISAAMPVPLPPPLTCTTIPGCAFMYSSANRWPRMTIVSEPLMVSGLFDACGCAPPAVDVCCCSRPPHAATARLRRIVETIRATDFMARSVGGGCGEKGQSA